MHIFILFLSLCFAGNTKFDDSWLNCSTDNQCVAIKGGCSWACVNSIHKKKAKEYYDGMAAVMECMGQESTKVPTTVCKKKKCECIEK